MRLLRNDKLQKEGGGWHTKITLLGRLRRSVILELTRCGIISEGRARQIYLLWATTLTRHWSGTPAAPTAGALR